MAGKPRGSVVYNKPLQIFVTEEMAEKLKAQAVSQTNGRVSELGRKALDEWLQHLAPSTAA